jgi:HAD superfamily hydrolase (TIGR01509 family)
MSAESSDTRISGVLFDVDGTLVDTPMLHAVCWAEALRQHGHVVETSVLHHAIGMSGEKLMAHALGEDHDTSEDEALETAHLTLYKQWWGRLNALPGAADLVRACHKNGLTVVLASSAKDEELDALRSALDADDAIDVATSSSDADSGKPDPDIIQVALKKAGLDPAEVVFVGDAVWDGYACAKAGVQFVGVTCGGTPEADLREAGAVEVWKNPAELLANLDESVLTSTGGSAATG